MAQPLTLPTFPGTYFTLLIHSSRHWQTHRQLMCRAAPTPFNSLIHTHAGEITPQMVAWLSSIKEKNLNNCGKFVLTGDMSQLSITKVDLSNMNTLEGTLGSRSVVRDAPTPHPLPLILLENLLHFDPHFSCHLRTRRQYRDIQEHVDHRVEPAKLPESHW